MRCPVLIGRDAEWAALGKLIESASRGRGGAAVVVGEAGVGKSRLVQDAQHRAKGAGMSTLLGRADPGSRTPLGPVAEALQAATRGVPLPDDDTLRPYVPVLATFLPHWRGPGWWPPTEMDVVVAEAILRLLESLARPSGLMLVLEDLHWADPTTMAVAAYLTEHLEATHLVMLLTVRDGEPRSLAAATLERRGAHRVSLGRLADDEVATMISACLGGAPSPEILDRVTRDSDGLPLLVEDLLVGGDFGSRRFADTVVTRLGQLDADERRIVGMAAILGPVASVVLLSAAGNDDSTVDAALRHCAALQLMASGPDGTLQFRHALTRDVVLAELAASEARSLRRAAAAAVSLSSSLARVPRDLLAAELLSDAHAGDEAARSQLAAGMAALEAGEIGRAIPALRRATVDAVDEDLSVDAGVALAAALLEQGDAGAADEIARPLAARLAGRDPEKGRAVWLLTARAATAAGRWDDAAAALRAIPAGDGNVTSAGISAEVAVLEARVALGVGHGDTRVDAEHLAHRAAALAAEVGRADLQCEALETAGLAARGRDLDVAAALLARALDLASAEGAGRRRLQVLNELAAVEMLRDARSDRLRLAIDEARRIGAVGTAVGAELNFSSLMVMTGRYQEAVALATSVAATAARLGLVPVEAAAYLMIGFAAAHQARRSEAEVWLARAESLAPHDPDLHAGAWAIGRGLLALLEEDRPAARHAFDRAHQIAPHVYARILNPYEGPDLLLRAVEGEVDLPTIETAVERAVRSARWSDLWLQAARAIALGANGQAELASSVAAGALRLGETYPVFHALALRLLAGSALRDGWGEPVPWLQQADATLDAVGARRAASACRALLKQAGRPAPRRRAADHQLPDQLRLAGVTAREAEILELLSDRLTNREMAGRLYLSPRTVEKHVASLLTKLNAADRASLAELGRSLRR